MPLILNLKGAKSEFPFRFLCPPFDPWFPSSHFPLHIPSPTCNKCMFLPDWGKACSTVFLMTLSGHKGPIDLRTLQTEKHPSKQGAIDIFLVSTHKPKSSFLSQQAQTGNVILLGVCPGKHLLGWLTTPKAGAPGSVSHTQMSSLSYPMWGVCAHLANGV